MCSTASEGWWATPGIPGITDSYATGPVSGEAGGNYIGGLIGSSLGTFADSYWDTGASGQSDSVGGYFPGHCAGVADGFLNHAYRLLFVRGLVGGPGRHDDLAGMVHHRLTVVRLLEVPATRPRHDAGLGIGEVALGLVLGHPRMGLTFDLGLFRRRLGLASNAAMASLVFSNRPSRKASFSGNSSPRLSFPYRRSSSSSTSWARRSNSATSAANCASFSFVRL